MSPLRKVSHGQNWESTLTCDTRKKGNKKSKWQKLRLKLQIQLRLPSMQVLVPLQLDFCSPTAKDHFRFDWSPWRGFGPGPCAGRPARLAASSGRRPSSKPLRVRRNARNARHARRSHDKGHQLSAGAVQRYTPKMAGACESSEMSLAFFRMPRGCDGLPW